MIGCMPTLHREAGFEFRFFAADAAEPPHIHVRGNGGSAKLWLPSLEVAAARGYNRRQLSQAKIIAAPHAANFLDRWHEFFD